MIRLTPDQQKKGALIGGFVLVAAAKEDDSTKAVKKARPSKSTLPKSGVVKAPAQKGAPR